MVTVMMRTVFNSLVSLMRFVSFLGLVTNLSLFVSLVSVGTRGWGVAALIVSRTRSIRRIVVRWCVAVA
jgi:hypothetical protein